MEVGIDALSFTVAGSHPKPKIRIVLVADHAILREGLKVLIKMEPDFDIVGEFGGVDECLAGIVDLQPDLVLTDLELPGRSGIELLAELRWLSPLTRKLVLTAHENEEWIGAALNAGANGYVLKNVNSAELMLAIRTVFRGQQFLCKAIAGKILSGYLCGQASDQRAGVPAVMRSITDREREVLTRIALGNSNKLIARDLGVSPKTVEKHRSNLMRKLQLHNSAAITMFAIRNGLTGSSPLIGPCAARPDSRWIRVRATAAQQPVLAPLGS
ncbi:MAG TPA: response regulator transcription factor [Steroidobacteraceae bacterium]|nr:response regulator transcription factor [Steroidobacteraceae bacterium]